MKDLMDQWEGTPYPAMIRNLPEIDLPIEGIRGWLLQSDDKQVVFFDIQPVGKVPPHSHCDQWGLMIEGEMSLTIGGETKTYRKGDWYYIPAGVEHSATFPTRVHVMDIFAAPDRYKPKK
ncbi:MAG: cupin domain-containing protein [Candidatus Aminicenantes bacterium]|jgi:mannose-6-phosphate isomerase-like protein (cupin superfamily)|nr:cupin domain-containing protein [Candidatus Aminicenantes bacterium]MDH5383938.1 cupin domain-containing protein [Candidatus Aminicenantes bacterium]MDH5743720.1 cupin domain-containing protein [Candidatus Aminicenantes bacterium]